VLSVPSSAVIFDAKGLSIATVDADNRVLLKPVSIERDLVRSSNSPPAWQRTIA